MGDLQQNDDDETPVEIPDDEGVPETGPRDVPDAGAGNDATVDLDAGDADDLDNVDEEDVP